MPTIPNFDESRNRLPEAPPSTDISPEKFGRDAAALAEFGGDMASLGGKLMEVRKRAIESDEIANGQTEALLKFSELEDAERANYQKALAASNGNVAGIPSPSESLKTKMEAFLQEKVKGMSTGDAQRAFLERVSPLATRSYLGSVDWENQTRAKAIIDNLATRGDLVSQDLYKSPSLSKTADYLTALREDLDAKTGSVLTAEQSGKAYRTLGKNYVASLVEGLANGTQADAEYAREFLKKMPPQMAELLDAGDLEKFDNRLKQADRERKIQFEIDQSAQKEALKINRDKAQDQILANIYEGKATVKDILYGTGKILDPDKKQQMINILQEQAKPSKIPSANAQREVISRIYADEDDPRKITSEDQLMKIFTDGKITFAQMNQARAELKRQNSPEGQIESELKKQLFKHAESILTKSNGGLSDPDGQAQMGKFMAFALGEIEEARKEKRPIKDLLDANSKNYLGNSLKNYQKSPQEIMKAQVERLKNTAAAKKAATQEPPEGMVRVIRPDGKTGMIPAANLDRALKSGFKQAAPSKGRSPQSIPSESISVRDLSDKDLTEAYVTATDEEKEEVEKEFAARGKSKLFEKAKQERAEAIYDAIKDTEWDESEPNEMAEKRKLEAEWDRIQAGKSSTKDEAPKTKKTEVKDLKTRRATVAEAKALKKSKEDWGEIR